jgi:hypothetical protein
MKIMKNLHKYFLKKKLNPHELKPTWRRGVAKEGEDTNNELYALDITVCYLSQRIWLVPGTRAKFAGTNMVQMVSICTIT